MRQFAVRQFPVFAASTLVQSLTFIPGFQAGAFSVIAVIFLVAILYTALHWGVRSGLISAAIALLYIVFSLGGSVEALTLADRNMRRIVLLAVILPALAYIVGRLKERNDYLLVEERKARLSAEESERRFRFMAESMPQKIFTTTPYGINEYLNPQWAEYIGPHAEQTLKGDWSTIILPDDVEDNIAQW